MQQRQLRLGDILDDYCPRERRLTNHAVVAMVGDEVKQTRCTTCDADHEYKHAKVPRQRKKDSPAGLQAQVLASGPKRAVSEPVVPEPPTPNDLNGNGQGPAALTRAAKASKAVVDPVRAAAALDPVERDDEAATEGSDESQDGEGPGDPGNDEKETDGPAHRRLIRAQLPKIEGQPPPARPAPDFTIRQPGGGRPGRFRPRPQRGGGQSFPGNRSGQGSGNQTRGGAPRSGGSGRAPMAPRPARRHEGGRKRSR